MYFLPDFQINRRWNWETRDYQKLVMAVGIAQSIKNARRFNRWTADSVFKKNSGIYGIRAHATNCFPFVSLFTGYALPVVGKFKVLALKLAALRA